MRRLILATAASGLLLSGCATQGGGYHTAQGAGLGAIGGAAAGAAVGAAVGGNVGNAALIGAGIGLLAGGAAGAYMDSQEQALRQDLAGTDVDVQRQGDEVILVMPSNVTFAVDSANILPGFRPSLANVAQTLRQNRQSTIQVHGHTDATGDSGYNQDLSEQRARAVVEFFKAQGIMPERLYWQGHGETQPIATNATPQGRQMNRRVELRIVPLTA